MAHKVADRVRETSTTSGTGSYTLAGAVTGFQTMAAALTVNSDTGFFFAAGGGNWEVFLGTRTSATVLARTTIYASSNAGAAVNWGTEVKDITSDVPARFCELLNTIEISVASAATCDIGAVHGSVIAVTGTTTITSFGTSTHKVRFVRFAGALTLTHNATSLITLDGNNIVTAAGDTSVWMSDGSGNWRCWSYSRANRPRFLAYNSANDVNATGDGTDVIIDYDTEVFDRASSFASDTYTPQVGGDHMLGGTVGVAILIAGHVTLIATLVTSNRTFRIAELNPQAMKDSANDTLITPFFALADMDAGDTATVRVIVNGSTKTVYIFGTGSPQVYFCGAYIG